MKLQLNELASISLLTVQSKHALHPSVGLGVEPYHSFLGVESEKDVQAKHALHPSVSVGLGVEPYHSLLSVESREDVQAKHALHPSVGLCVEPSQHGSGCVVHGRRSSKIGL
jgi:hypothetical protein